MRGVLRGREGGREGRTTRTDSARTKEGDPAATTHHRSRRLQQDSSSSSSSLRRHRRPSFTTVIHPPADPSSSLLLMLRSRQLFVEAVRGDKWQPIVGSESGEWANAGGEQEYRRIRLIEPFILLVALCDPPLLFNVHTESGALAGAGGGRGRARVRVRDEG